MLASLITVTGNFWWLHFRHLSIHPNAHAHMHRYTVKWYVNSVYYLHYNLNLVLFYLFHFFFRGYRHNPVNMRLQNWDFTFHTPLTQTRKRRPREGKHNYSRTHSISKEQGWIPDLCLVASFLMPYETLWFTFYLPGWFYSASPHCTGLRGLSMGRHVPGQPQCLLLLYHVLGDLSKCSRTLNKSPLCTPDSAPCQDSRL